MWAKQKGFTIVELLIVIVVIAILAAIVIVAFNGVQKRSSLARKHSEISSISKAAMAYEISSGTTVAVNSESMTAAQIDATIAAMGLSNMRNSMVIDSALLVNNNNCRQAPMTKNTYCLAINGKNARVVYWHDIDSKWVNRQYYEGGFSESDIGTGAYPDYQSY